MDNSFKILFTNEKKCGIILAYDVNSVFGSKATVRRYSPTDYGVKRIKTKKGEKTMQKETKLDIIQTYATHEGDTGSAILPQMRSVKSLKQDAMVILSRI